MTALATNEPAVAAAMGRCLTARSLSAKDAITARHPRPCGWCDYPRELLDGAVREWTARAEFDRNQGTDTSGYRTFRRLDPDEREQLIRAAQELMPDEPASIAIATPPANAPEEESPWLQ